MMTATDPDGNISEFSACVQNTATVGAGNYSWHYVYDGLNRVVRACSDGWNEGEQTCSGSDFRYDYDGAGNATRFDRWNDDTSQVETVLHTYNDANQLATTCLDADHSGTCNGSETPVSYIRTMPMGI